MYEDDRTEEQPERSYYTVDEDYNEIVPDGHEQDSAQDPETGEGAACPDGQEEQNGESQGAGYDYSKSPGYDAVFGENESAPVILRKKKKHKKKHYFLRFCAAAALIAAAVYIMMSPYFDVTALKIEGNSNVSDSQVIELAGVQKGDHIFADLLTKRVKIKHSLKKETFIKDVSISADLPGTLIIRVTERKPDCVILVGGKYMMLDHTGYIIRKQDARPAEVTILQGVKIKGGEQGETAEADSREQLDEMLGLIKAANDNDLYFKKVVCGKSVTRAYVYDTLLVRGTPKDIKKQIKNGNLKKVLYDLYKKGVKTGTVSVGSGRYISFSPKLK